MNAIKKIRELTGMSQVKLAKHFRVPVGTIRRWEQGYANPSEYLQEMMIRILILEDNEYPKEDLKELQEKIVDDVRKELLERSRREIYGTET